MGFIVLIVLPAILMGVAIWAASYLQPIVEVLRRSVVILGISVILLIGIIVLVAPYRVRYDIVNNIQLFGPILLAGIAGFLLQYSLRDSHRVHWWCIAISMALFIAGCFLLWWLASLGGLATLCAFFTALSSVGVTTVAAIWMARSLWRWRKLTALLVGFVIPAAFVASVLLGETQSPEDITQRNGNIIVQALEQRRSESGVYPTSLDKLVPVCLNELPEALTTQGTGWLYTSDGSQYTLGYWDDPRWFGVNLCLHSSESKGWRCKYTYGYQDWSPFSPVPTPTPKP